MAKKSREVLMNVIYNTDRNSIVNGESWVYTDSLNIGKTVEVEHKEILKKIRQVLKDYNLEDGDKIAPSSDVEEFIYKNTDFSYSISYYRNTQNKLQPYYKLSKDLTTILLFKFTTDRAKEFQKLYIAKFNTMEKELDWFKGRYNGIITRTTLTDTIKDYYEIIGKERPYIDFTDLVYEVLYGYKAYQIRNINKHKFDEKHKNIRPWLSDEDIKLVDGIEREIAILIKYNMNYYTIRDMVINKNLSKHKLTLLDEIRK